MGEGLISKKKKRGKKEKKIRRDLRKREGVNRKERVLTGVRIS